MSGFAGNLKPSLYLPVFCSTLSLQIHVFDSPCPLLSLLCCCGIALLACLSFRSAAGVCRGQGRTQMARCHGRASSRASLIPTRVQGCSGFRKKYHRHVGLLVPSPIWNISSSRSTALRDNPSNTLAPVCF